MGEVDILKKQIDDLNDKLDFFQKNQKELIKQALAEFANQQKKNSLKSEFDRKFRKSKKQIIKQKIIETAKTKPISLSDLKYYIVNQLNYCSKASFYRYIEELKEDINIDEGIVKISKEIIV